MCGLMPVDEVYARYEAASGLRVDRERLRFYEVLNRYQQLQIVLGTAYRVVHLGKSHQNIVIARLQRAAWMLAEDLRTALEEGSDDRRRRAKMITATDLEYHTRPTPATPGPRPTSSRSRCPSST